MRPPLFSHLPADLSTLIDVLVIPKRVTPRFSDLTPEEVSDLFLSVQSISRVVEKEYRAGSAESLLRK